ncbi:VWA domain-containing protein [Teredinibacter sp. KSP-S5-2]|uniref:vWA domain-containing protein n=1 Tax=Teredinibacter sp. KSP-S5-2 TaxID=3034506 RepID=UPI002934AAA5|nr:VWA domain-containing protein [Teredinibacter sp. KSP-S5-2]WNO08325.1 VWA domain-containing protein [Teredinibacter sp. KSP-S5-2]
MNENELKQLLNQVEDIQIDPKAKAKAMALAMQEFDKVQEQTQEKNSQGIAHFFRLTCNSVKTSGRTIMELLNQKWFLGATASVCTVFLGVILFIQPKDSIQVDSSKVAPLPELASQAAPEPEKLVRSKSAKKELNTNAAPDVQMMIEEEVVVSGIREQIIPAGKAFSSPQPKRMISPAARVAADFAQGYMPQEVNNNEFESFEPQGVKSVAIEPVSTFSIDVDTTSYSFVRRQLNMGNMPERDAIRLEEMVNYFDYQYPMPTNKNTPFKPSITVVDSPWNSGNKLVHIGIKGYDIPLRVQPKVNLVFLLDVSGSMNAPDKLPLVKKSMELLLSQLSPEDTVAIAVYAGAAGTVLEPTQVKEKHKILSAMNGLSAGGSTAGALGIELAYQLAQQNFDKNAVNRIILATDGDFNVGISNPEQLKHYVEEKRKTGVFLSVLGFGDGNYKDSLTQALAQNGNGVAAYIDTLNEAQKVLVKEARSSLFPIAKDVKIQVEFNPSQVAEYRLLGYETRALAKEDFNNDKVDAGEIGSGHTVTAIYEITPVNSHSALVDAPRYAKNKPNAPGLDNSSSDNMEYGFIKIRYKLPYEDVSTKIEAPILVNNQQDSNLTEVNFSVAVAGFAELLKGGKYTRDWTYDDALNLAQKNKGEDLYGYRAELVQLIRNAKIAH